MREYAGTGFCGGGPQALRTLLSCGVLGIVLGFAAEARADSTLLAPGNEHTCVRSALGAVQCAGSNGAGQLGDGTFAPHLLPGNVSGLGAGVIAVASGNQHSCALTTTGAVKCWGSSSFGQLGNGSFSDAPAPVNVVGLGSGVAAISAASLHTCALLNSGGVKCWGDNASGQLGDGTQNYSTVPVNVVGLASGVAAISTGGAQTCALTNAGGVKCWGANESGELGTGALYPYSATPVDVSGLGSGVKSISSGLSHSCAITGAGALKCWGQNNEGGLGNNSYANSPLPVSVTGMASNTAVVSAGLYYTCALLTTGNVKCWGRNAERQLGDGTKTTSPVPVDVVGLEASIVDLKAGSFHACGVASTGAVRCWGSNLDGQQGNGTQTNSQIPVDVFGLSSGVLATTAGSAHTCALLNGGAVKCWGFNDEGQLGNNSQEDADTPVAVSGLGSGVAAIAAGQYHTCALTNGGTVKCWGENYNGQLGNNLQIRYLVPVDVSNIGALASAITAGGRFGDGADGSHSCALTTANGVKCWGRNLFGALGNGLQSDSPTPVAVSGLASGVGSISAGGNHTCARTDTGAAKCWGRNDRGQVGNGLQSDVYAPADVNGLGSGVAQLDAGGRHTCARTAAGSVKCWGSNYSGQLGNASNADSSIPVDVSGIASGALSVSAGDEFSCAIAGAGALRCWGWNYYGQLGNGTQESSNVPTQVTGLASGVSAISAGGAHACAITASGGLKCWGSNMKGQLGTPPPPTLTQFSYFDTRGTGYVPAPPLPPPPSASGKAGSSIAAAPGLVAIGAPESTIDGSSSGQVFVYTGAGLVPSAARAPPDSGGKALAAANDVNLATLQLPFPINGDKFGGAVAVSTDGNTIAVGAPSVDANKGAVYIFQKPAGGWSGTLNPGQKAVPVNAASGDQVGASVAITNAGTIVAGAPGTVVSGQSGAGTVIVLRKGEGTYTISLPLTPAIPQAGAGFGSSVSGEGSDVAVGAPGQNVGVSVDQGQVETFREQGGNYAPLDVVTDTNGVAGDRFGASVAISDGTLIVGAPGQDQPSAPDAGAAEVFEQTPTGEATPIATLTDPEADPGAALGTSVDLDDGRAVVGEPMVDILDNVDQGGAQVYLTPEETNFTGPLIPNGTLFDPFGEAGDHYGNSVYIGDTLAAIGAPDAGPVSAAAKAAGVVVKPGEGIAYSDDRIFRGGMESVRGTVDGCSAPNLAIPDNAPAGVTNDIALNASGSVKDLNVRVRIEHTYVSDLRLTLTHVPSGKSVPLYVPSVSCSLDDLDIDFDDQALDGYARDKCSNGAAAIEGRRLPNDWLTIVQGVTREGPWRLKIVDAAAADTGTLQGWCVDAR